MYLLAVVKRVVKRNWYSKSVGKTDKKGLSPERNWYFMNALRKKTLKVIYKFQSLKYILRCLLQGV